ncbi:MAG: hypothetical protein KAS87_02060 [Candidatus Omnitrophica bacterium]|nr:hypothetical protein [Candidatus Omnitrophota bacterium]
MLEINLLPLQMRKKKSIFPSVFLCRIGGLFLFLLIVISLFVIAVRSYQTVAYRKMKQEWVGFFQLENMSKQLNKEKEDLEKYLKRGILWSKKFDSINKFLPRGVWLTTLCWQEDDKSKENIFIIKGRSLILEKEAMANIIKFMDNLKNDKVFFSDFKKIELITRKKSEKAMGFELQIR